MIPRMEQRHRLFLRKTRDVGGASFIPISRPGLPLRQAMIKRLIEAGYLTSDPPHKITCEGRLRVRKVAPGPAPKHDVAVDPPILGEYKRRRVEVMGLHPNGIQIICREVKPFLAGVFYAPRNEIRRWGTGGPINFKTWRGK